MRRILFVFLFSLVMSAAVQAGPLSSFSATGQSRQVVVRWELSSPLPIARFDVIRNGLAAARVPGESDLAYEWTDKEVQNDRLYSYTLVAVHVDGSRQTMGTVSARPAYDAGVVRQYRLHQNFPNPFNPETTIEIELAQSGPATLTIFDVLGQEVAKPFSGSFASGRYSVLFNGQDLPSGVYFYQLNAGGFVDQKKMVLLK
ncbi:MAG: T9SS type A sorting domain-containing protein [Calditrichaeota bacterium]|nr:T9SS type A sorting domain-containing protein [Calditrichota bacterium]MCB9365661.1 T9SS type A sorting domain-containing protein [Calditrichota bacterium]MCB9391948.1 T9SS type A sorting domain-containing protein [Calditrichota bacterium]